MALIFGPTRWQFDFYKGLGCCYDGGRIICRSGGILWIVAPNTSEVLRSWYCRDDAVTTAQSVSGRTGWFIPTICQLCNPGYVCGTYWDSISGCRYWSNTETDAFCARAFGMPDGFGHRNRSKGISHYAVRAFRCVTY